MDVQEYCVSQRRFRWATPDVTDEFDETAHSMSPGHCAWVPRHRMDYWAAAVGAVSVVLERRVVSLRRFWLRSDWDLLHAPESCVVVHIWSTPCQWQHATCKYVTRSSRCTVVWGQRLRRRLLPRMWMLFQFQFHSVCSRLKMTF